MSDESDLIAALRRAAHVTDQDVFDVSRQGVLIHVQYSGGSSSSLTLSASYDQVARNPQPGGQVAHYRDSAQPAPLVAIRPMAIILRAETGEDRSAKQEGISREFQTGDAAFDHAIYVDSPTVDERVLSAVLTPATRHAAQALIGLGFSSIHIDDPLGQVAAALSTFASRDPGEVRVEEMLTAFGTLASELPVVRASSEAHPGQPLKRFNLGAGILVGTAALAAIPVYFGIAGAHDCTDSSDDGESLKDGCAGPGLMAVGAGVVVGLFAYLLVRGPLQRRFRGQSNSHAQIGTAGCLTFALVGLACFYVLSVVLFGMR